MSGRREPHQRSRGIELLEVSTGCRLHFGLMELTAGEPLRFGGLGLMLDEPGWVLRFEARASSSSADQPLSDDVRQRLEAIRERMRQEFQSPFDVAISVQRPLPMHSGLGAGTQLAAAAALGLHLMEQSRAARSSAQPTVEELVRWTGRGKRSGIGLYGFLTGGLILDEGHGSTRDATDDATTGRQISATSITTHPDWRVVLITPDQVPQVTGSYESTLIERLGRTPHPNREQMFHAAKHIQSLAGKSDSFAEFSEVLQTYVDAAGKMFAAEQGGLYNGASVSRAVELAKQAGLRAVGQSSWGPTVFGFATSPDSAEQIAGRIVESRPNAQWQVRVCSAARQGAKWRWLTQQSDSAL